MKKASKTLMWGRIRRYDGVLTAVFPTRQAARTRSLARFDRVVRVEVKIIGRG